MSSPTDIQHGLRFVSSLEKPICQGDCLSIITVSPSLLHHKLGRFLIFGVLFENLGSQLAHFRRNLQQKLFDKCLIFITDRSFLFNRCRFECFTQFSEFDGNFHFSRRELVPFRFDINWSISLGFRLCGGFILQRPRHL